MVSEVKVKTYTISEWRCKQGWGKPPRQGLFSPGAKGQSQAYQSFPGSLGEELAPGSPRPSSAAHHYERKGYGKLVWLLSPSSVEDPSGKFPVEKVIFAILGGNHVLLWQSLPVSSSLGTICCWMNALSPDQQPSLAPRCSSKPQPDSSPLSNLLGAVSSAATPSD